MTHERFVGMADLVARWTYSRMGVHKVSRWEDFPAPAFAINRGRTKVWRLADIEAFEKNHPELTSEHAKSQKQYWYATRMGTGEYQPRD